jgi:hypothetical protein
MGKLVSEHCPKLGDGEDREQGQAESHDATAAEAHYAAAVGDEGIRVWNQVDLARQSFVERRSDIVKFSEEPALILSKEGHSGRLESIASRYQGPEHGGSDDDPE